MSLTTVLACGREGFLPRPSTITRAAGLVGAGLLELGLLEMGLLELGLLGCVIFHLISDKESDFMQVSLYNNISFKFDISKPTGTFSLIIS